MSVQIIGQNGQVYDPNRDMAYLFPRVVLDLQDKVMGTPPRWREFWEVAHRLQVTREQVEQGLEVVMRFSAAAVDDPKKSMVGLLIEKGWFELPMPVRILIPATIGLSCMGLFFSGARMATFDGRGPCDIFAQIQTIPGEIGQASPPMRWYRKIGHRLGIVWAALRGVYG